MGLKKVRETYSSLVKYFFRRLSCFSDAEVKVLGVLLSRVRYDLEHGLVIASLNTITEESGIRKGRLMKALETLTLAGLVKVYSPVKDKKTVRKLKEKIFKRKVLPIRNESNVYDLTPFITFLKLMKTADEQFQRKFLLYYKVSPKSCDYPSVELCRKRRELSKDGTVPNLLSLWERVYKDHLENYKELYGDRI